MSIFLNGFRIELSASTFKEVEVNGYNLATGRYKPQVAEPVSEDDLIE